MIKKFLSKYILEVVPSIVATVIGAALLGDHMRPGWTIPAIIGIAITLGATVVLARSPAQELEHRTITANTHPSAQGSRPSP